MATPVRLYQEEMHSNVGFFATWLPGDVLELGDIGALENGRFRRAGSLRELGFTGFQTREGTPQNMSYSAAADKKVGGTAGVSAPMDSMKAELSIRFTKQGGYVFEAAGIRNIEIADRMMFSDRILELYGQPRWKREWLVVDAVYKAHSATIIVSEDDSSEIVLKASAALPLGSLPLADPNLGLSMSSCSGRITQVLVRSELTPLYSCVRVRQSLFGEATVTSVRGIGEKSMGLSRLSIGDLLNS
jgi:hypothetical protein